MIDVPRFGIRREQGPLAPSVQEQLTGLRLSQLASAPAQLELTWQAGAGDELPQFDLGEQISLTAAGDTLFAGRVSATEVCRERAGHSVLNVRAYDRLEALRQKSHARKLQGAGFSGLMSELCASHGLRVEGFEGAAVSTLAQSGRTDLELLRDLTRARGCYFHLEADRLIGFRLLPGSPRLTKRWSDFWTCRCERNVRRAPGRIRVSGSALGQAEFFRAEAQADSGAASEGAEQHRLGEALHSTDEAEGLARGLAERARAQVCVFHGTLMPGDLRLRPGLTLELANIPGQGAQSFVLTHVTHGYDAAEGGFYTEVSSAPPADEALEARKRTPVSVGEVKELDDRGRVRVYFATHDALSDWLRVVAAGAGENRGLACLPDVGDEVVVLTPDGDPLHGVVLGGVWKQGPADSGVSSGRRRHVQWRLARGHIDIDADRDRVELVNGASASVRLERHQVSLDAAGGTLQLSNGQGSRFELTGAESKWSSSKPLVIEAPGQTLTIRAAKINLEQG